MSKSVLDAKSFHDEAAAYAWVEARVWPNGPICPHCGGVDRIGKLGGKSTRIGVYKCYQCRKPFSVKVGTVFEASHVPMRIWLQAMHLLCSSKKGISSNQLHRILGVDLKTAWFMSHRIRLAMQAVGLEPMGGARKVVEVDETMSGRQDGSPNPRGYKRDMRGYGRQFRNVVLTLVERGGSARSFHIEGTTIATLMPVLRANIHPDSTVMTDAAGWYHNLGAEFRRHESVNHEKGEYVSGGGFVHSNTVENFYSVFKRGMKGVYQHCNEKHLHRYLAEFDFRYSNRIGVGVDDVARTERAVAGIVGKRLRYRGPRKGKVIPFPNATA
jgi:transposase-like protein